MKTSNNKFWMALGTLALLGASTSPVYAQGKTGNGGGGTGCGGIGCGFGPGFGGFIGAGVGVGGNGLA
jgi:hypothetical protein